MYGDYILMGIKLRFPTSKNFPVLRRTRAMSKEVLKAMIDELSKEIEDCRRALDYCCAHENLKEEWSDKIFKAYIIMCYHE